LVGNNLNTAPGPIEIEVTIFGPGYGESILLHMGSNKWVIVDSCINPTSNEPAPLTYLKQINVDPATAVKQVIISHWHDDHYRGIAKIVEVCSTAEFFCSAALKSEELSTTVFAYGNYKILESSGIDELKRIYEILRERANLNGGRRYIPPTFVAANQTLYRNSECSILSLSPSSASILAAQIEFAKMLSEDTKFKKRLIPMSTNLTAVVLWVAFGDFSILLGSDLEETGDANIGWSVIVNSPLRPDGKASCFKIPHHGSENAHHSDVWENMVEKESLTVLTPYENAGTKLPRKADVERICSLTSKAFSTAMLEKKRTIKRHKSVERTIREMGLNIRQLPSSFGYVRLRGKPSCDWTIDLSGDAVPLNNIYFP